MPATYTDRLEGVATSEAVKTPCRAATTAAITASGLQTIDGVVLASGDRVLRKDETDHTLNGIWNAASSTWTRALDFDGSRDVVGGTLVHVNSGAVNGNTYWTVSGNGTKTVGTDAITFNPSSGTIDLQAALAASSGATLVGSNDGSSGSLWTTIAGFITYLRATTGAALVGFSHSSTYAAGTLGKHDQNLIYVQDAPYSATLDGSTNDSTAFAAAIAATGAKRGVLSGAPGKSMRVNTAQDITTPITITGVVGQPGQNSSTLPSFALLGGSSSYILKFAAGSTGSKLKDIAIENVGTCTDAIQINGATALRFESITALNWASSRVRFSRSLIYSAGGFIEYAKFSNLNVLSTSTPNVIYVGAGANFAPFLIEKCHELSAIDGDSMNVVKIDQCAGDGIYIRENTFNSYVNSELTVVDTTSTDTVVDYNTGHAVGLIDFSNNEIDMDSPLSTYRAGRVYNVGSFRVSGGVTGGGSSDHIFDLFNTRATISSEQANSINGSYFNILDLESAVAVEQGLTLSLANVNLIFNPAVTLAAGSFTGATTNASYVLTVSAVVSGKVYPGLVITGTNIPANTVVQKQLSSNKSGTGTYLLSKAATGTATGTALAQAAGTYPVNSGLHTIPPLVEGVTNKYFIQPHLLNSGVNAFVIQYDTSMVSGGVGLAVTILMAQFNDTSFRPTSRRTRGQRIPLLIINTSGVAMGAITWGAGVKVSASFAAPADGFTCSIEFITDQTISGGVATDVFRQLGKEVSDVPN